MYKEAILWSHTLKQEGSSKCFSYLDYFPQWASWPKGLDNRRCTVLYSRCTRIFVTLWCMHRECVPGHLLATGIRGQHPQIIGRLVTFFEQESLSGRRSWSSMALDVSSMMNTCRIWRIKTVTQLMQYAVLGIFNYSQEQIKGSFIFQYYRYQGLIDSKEKRAYNWNISLYTYLNPNAVVIVTIFSNISCLSSNVHRRQCYYF